MKTLLTAALAATALLAACSHGTPQTAATHTYRCVDGSTLRATYPTTETATVHYQGASRTLQIVRSGSGARYTGDGWQWWTKGDTGTLSRLGADGYGDEVLAECQAP
ncbi:MliC family protein [Pulveribacter suum]|nr:MliC family protein [Pulveribacter suum]